MTCSTTTTCVRAKYVFFVASSFLRTVSGVGWYRPNLRYLCLPISLSLFFSHCFGETGWKIRLNSDMLTNSISAYIKMGRAICRRGRENAVMVVVPHSKTKNDFSLFFFPAISHISNRFGLLIQLKFAVSYSIFRPIVKIWSTSSRTTADRISV